MLKKTFVPLILAVALTVFALPAYAGISHANTPAQTADNATSSISAINTNVIADSASITERNQKSVAPVTISASESAISKAKAQAAKKTSFSKNRLVDPAESSYITLPGYWTTVHHAAPTQTVHHDPVYQTVHHDAVYETVHHDAEYETVHHDAVYETVHHDDAWETVHHDAVYNYYWSNGYYKTVHHDATTEKHAICSYCGKDWGTRLPSSGEYDEHRNEMNADASNPYHLQRMEVHYICNGCGYDFGMDGPTDEEIEEHMINDPCDENGNPLGGAFHSIGVYNQWYQINEVTIPAWDEEVWVDYWHLVEEEVSPAWDEEVFVPAHDEQVLVSEAYDEQVLVSEAWDEEVLVTEAWDEQVLVAPAWDEEVVVGPAWDEDVYVPGSIVAGYMPEAEDTEMSVKELINSTGGCVIPPAPNPDDPDDPGDSDDTDDETYSGKDLITSTGGDVMIPCPNPRP